MTCVVYVSASVTRSFNFQLAREPLQNSNSISSCRCNVWRLALRKIEILKAIYTNADIGILKLE